LMVAEAIDPDRDVPGSAACAGCRHGRVQQTN
jgi:hypothetical protein